MRPKSSSSSATALKNKVLPHSSHSNRLDGGLRQDPLRGEDAAVSTQRLNQLVVEAMMMGAREAAARKNLPEALALLGEAHRRDPGHVYVLLNMAVLHGKNRDYEGAEQALAGALKLAPRDARLHGLIAQAYSTIDRPDRAVDFYRSSLSHAGDAGTRVQALVELAGLLERRHELDPAHAALQEALRLDPTHKEALFLSAQLDLRRGEETLGESRLRALLRGPCPPALRVKAAHELAGLLDRQGDYEQAYRTLLAAKERVRQEAPGSGPRDNLRSRWEELRQSLDAKSYDRFAACAAEDTPRRCAILTGHPRTGTTLLEQVLGAHDGLVSADELDTLAEWIINPVLRDFHPHTPILAILDRLGRLGRDGGDDDLHEVRSDVREAARQAYFRKTESGIGNPIKDRILLAKNPALTEALPLINWALPEMKMIIALRDPRDVILSCFMLNTPLTSVSANWLSIEEAADYYAHQMRCWLTVRSLSRTPWIEVRYEDTVADLEKQARRVLEFLGLPWTAEVLRFHEHARSKRIRSPTYKDVTQPVYGRAVGRWQNYARYLAPVEEKLAPFLAAFGY